MSSDTGKEEEKAPELTAEQLQELIRAENQKIIQACSAEIEAILAKHGCSLMPVVQIRGQQIVSYVEIVRNS